MFEFTCARRALGGALTYALSRHKNFTADKESERRNFYGSICLLFIRGMRHYVFRIDREPIYINDV